MRTGLCPSGSTQKRQASGLWWCVRADLSQGVLTGPLGSGYRPDRTGHGRQVMRERCGVDGVDIKCNLSGNDIP